MTAYSSMEVLEDTVGDLGGRLDGGDVEAQVSTRATYKAIMGLP